ncbi:MAG: 4'-phosphopantetheinyl transferase superfamily protein [Solirubrobacteraceae bacterium]
MTAVHGAPQIQIIRADEREEAAALNARCHALDRAAGARFVSRSYRFPFAVLAWHDQPVGVDIERIEACPPGFAASISTPTELALRIAGDEETISLWCSKEALAKALGDALDYDPRRLESPVAWPEGHAGPWRAARQDAPGGHVVWLCWRAQIPHAHPAQ